MDESNLHAWCIWLELGLAAVTVVATLMVDAPYGRYARKGWGPQIPAKVGWIVMESPAVLVFAAIYLQGDHRVELVPLCLLAMWQAHYINRTYIFPFRMRSEGKTMPAAVAGLAVVFNVLNAYINARWISHLGQYAPSWLLDPRFLVGLVLFVVGYRINREADRTLFALRQPGETGYKIPEGGLYRVISCPNYFGEIVMWIGFAVAAWSLAAVAFVAYSAANLGPRALANHRWYREKFPNYPSERRAIIPFVL
jgi:protein-S-isoprenylcysteine O-methyltransferase Ste14